jgi:glycosyltransferase involved in cell wall biosynthesis
VGKTLVILTFNEIEGIKSLYDRIPFKEVGEYFVVDGGSTDGTIEFFNEKNIPVVIQDKPGRAEAFRVGINKANGENIIFFSPDGNEDPNDIPRLLNLLEKGYDMAIASRFLPGSRNEEDEAAVPVRAWVNRTFTFLANSFWNKRQYITDTINGYRAVKKSVFLKMNIDASGFVVEYQMSIRAMKLGLKVAEIPTYEGNRIGGKSKAKSLPTGVAFVRFLAREILTGNKF